MQVPGSDNAGPGSDNAGPRSDILGAGIDVGRNRNTFREKESKRHNVGV